MSVKDMQLKKEILELFNFKELCQFISWNTKLKLAYINHQFGEAAILQTKAPDFDFYICFFKQNRDHLRVAENMYVSTYKRWNRIRDRIKEMLTHDDNIIFCTLTFNNEYLDKLDPKTRRRYVQQWCSQFNDYVANIDYGGINGREHYHAVVRSDKFIDLDSWKYGFTWFEDVYQYASDEKLAVYINKLTNHALKIGDDSKLIYPKKRKSLT